MRCRWEFYICATARGIKLKLLHKSKQSFTIETSPSPAATRQTRQAPRAPRQRCNAQSVVSAARAGARCDRRARQALQSNGKTSRAHANNCNAHRSCAAGRSVAMHIALRADGFASRANWHTDRALHPIIWPRTTRFKKLGAAIPPPISSKSWNTSSHPRHSQRQRIIAPNSNPKINLTSTRDHVASLQRHIASALIAMSRSLNAFQEQAALSLSARSCSGANQCVRFCTHLSVPITRNVQSLGTWSRGGIAHSFKPRSDGRSTATQNTPSLKLSMRVFSLNA